MRLFKHLIIPILALSLAESAQALELLVWRAGPGITPLILPVRDGESPGLAADRYLELLESTPDLQTYSGIRTHLKEHVFEKLSPIDLDFRSLLIGNMSSDFSPNDNRVARFTKFLDQNQSPSYLLPIAADAGLSPAESKTLNKLIIENFPMLVAMGGHDVDPKIYSEPNRYSKGTNYVRDRFEASLIRDYVKSAKGFMLGVCRGLQITAAALGYKLVQDIPTEVQDHLQHQDSSHRVKVLDTKHGIFKRVASGEVDFTVNSFHHQAVVYHPEGPLELAAISEDGVAEGFDFKNGKGALIQSHPEFASPTEGAIAFRVYVDQKNKMIPVRTCTGLFGR